MVASIIQTARIRKDAGVSRMEKVPSAFNCQWERGCNNSIQGNTTLIALYQYSDAIGNMNEQGMWFRPVFP